MDEQRVPLPPSSDAVPSQPCPDWCPICPPTYPLTSAQPWTPHSLFQTDSIPLLPAQAWAPQDWCNHHRVSSTTAENVFTLWTQITSARHSQQYSLYTLDSHSQLHGSPTPHNFQWISGQSSVRESWSEPPHYSRITRFELEEATWTWLLLKC